MLAALAFLRGYWRLIVIAALAVALVLAWNSRNGWKKAAGSWRETAGTWQTAFDTQKAGFEAMQSAARVRAEAARIETESRFRTLAERADHADTEIADLRAAAARFARANHADGLRARAGTDQADAGGTAAATEAGTASGDNRSGDDAVVVPRGDFDALVENTIRLKQAHDWGEGLITEGLAAKLEED